MATNYFIIINKIYVAGQTIVHNKSPDIVYNSFFQIKSVQIIIALFQRQAVFFNDCRKRKFVKNVKRNYIRNQ